MMKKVLFVRLCIFFAFLLPVFVKANEFNKMAGSKKINHNLLLSFSGISIHNNTFSSDSIHNYNDTLILLPMTLLEFNVRQVDNDCHVNWQAVLEEYSKPFQIERSTDGKNYTEIGSTLSRGKQIGLQQFTFTDYGAVNLGARVIFYRLRQLNAEGKSEYTHTLAITVNYKGSFANIFPNPAVDHARLEVHALQEEKLNWNLTDQFGRTLKTGQPRLSPGATLIDVDLKSLPPGIYYVQLRSPSVSSQLKLLKL